MRHKIQAIFIVFVILFINISCSHATTNAMPVKGKFVFYGLRDAKVGWAAYLLKDGKLLVLGKKLTSPVFSPDGKTIAATHKEGIVLLDEEGNQKDLIPTYARPFKIRWSPDENNILYSIKSEANDRAVLRLVNLKTKEDRLFLDTGKDTMYTGLAYSPDGDRLLVEVYGFIQDRGGLFVCDSNGGNLRMLRKYGVSEAWALDGKHVYAATNKDENGKRINDKFGAIFKMNVDTGKITHIRDLDILLLSAIKLSKNKKYFYFSKSQGQDGRHIVLWPVNDPAKEINVTETVSLGPGYGLSQDQYPDWYQE